MNAMNPVWNFPVRAKDEFCSVAPFPWSSVVEPLDPPGTVTTIFESHNGYGITISRASDGRYNDVLDSRSTRPLQGTEDLVEPAKQHTCLRNRHTLRQRQPKGDIIRWGPPSLR